MSSGLTSGPKLTIVIPTLNRARLVGRAVESALAQNRNDIEILVSNNGSSDDTRQVLDRYRDPRLRILHRNQTISVTAHGNFLLEQARGGLFLGLSDDDWLEPAFAGRVIDFFERRSGVAFVWTGCWIHYGDVAMPAHIGPEIETGPAFLSAFLAGSRNVCWCACVCRTEDLRRIGPIPEGVICGDMFYWTKLASQGDIGCIGEPLSHYVCYRDDGDGMSGGTPVLAWARETQRWASDIASAAAVGRDGVRVQRDARRFVARSTANQFVWTVLRGTTRSELLRAFPSVLPFLLADELSHWIRVAAAFVAPRRLLRQRMLAEARRRRKRAERQMRLESC